MKTLLAIAVLSLASISANAAGSYALTVVTAYNAFSGSGTSVLSGPVATAGTATVDGLGIVSAAGIQWSFAARLAYEYTNGTWSAVVGGETVTHTENCVEIAGSFCTSPVSGLAGLWTTGLQNGGATSNSCSPNAFFGGGPCDRVSITEVAGVSLTIIEQSEFAIPGLAAGNILRFTAVPVPPAIWLFGSALGLIGVMRRKIPS